MTEPAAPPAGWWKTVSVAELRDAEHVIRTALRAAWALSADEREQLARALAIRRLCFADANAEEACVNAVLQLAQQARECLAADPPQWPAALQAERGGETLAEALGRGQALAGIEPGTRAYAGVEACRLTVTVLQGEMRTFAMRQPVIVKPMPQARFKRRVFKV